MPMKSVDEPESPSFSPDGRTVAFSALRGGIGDIYTVDLDTQRGRQPHHRRLRRLRRRPTRPTASTSIYNARVSGNQKLFRLDLDTKKKTQLTFGTHDETAAQFLDDHTIVFSSTATDPAVPLEPEVAKNGNIYNIWTLDLNNGELRQYTDALGGNSSPIVLQRRQAEPDRVRQLLQGRLRHPHARAQGAAAHRAPAPTSARPDRSSTSRRRCQHTLVTANARQEGHVREDVPRGPAAGERRRHQQRRRLRRHADQLRRRARRQAVQPVRRVDRRSTARCRSAYVNLARRFQFALQGFSQTQFFYGQLGGAVLRSGARAAHQPRRWRSRRAPCAAAAPSASTRSTATAGSSCRAAWSSSNEEYNDPSLAGLRRPVPAAALRPAGVPQRHAACRSASRSSRRRPSSASSARWPAARCGWPTTSRRRSATRCRARPSTATPATTCGSATSGLLATAAPRLQEHRRLPRLPLLRRQLGDARLRLPAVRRPERRVRQRRAALPDHRGGAHADRRHRRRPRRVLRQHRRRLVQQSGLQVRDQQHRRRQDHRRLPARPLSGQTHLRPGHQPADSDLRRRPRPSAGSG